MEYCIQNGLLQGVKHIKCPNFNQRPEAAEVSLLVVHNISLPPEQFGGPYIEQFFTNQLDPNAHPYFATIYEQQVSSHLLINRQGEIIQFVNFDDRAWHAGRSSFKGEVECNDFGVGVELEGSDTQPFSEAQYQQLAEFSRALMKSYPKLTSERITGHSDIAPGRKTDPGPLFDWPRFRNLLKQ